MTRARKDWSGRGGRWLRDLVAILILALILGLASKWLHPRAPAWRIDSGAGGRERILLSEIDDLYAGKVLWVDARSEERFCAGHVPGALRIEMADPGGWLYEHFDALGVETRPVVVYDGSREGDVAARAAAYLRSNTQLDPVLVLEGGWSSWRDAAGAVEPR